MSDPTQRTYTVADDLSTARRMGSMTQRCSADPQG